MTSPHVVVRSEHKPRAVRPRPAYRVPVGMPKGRDNWRMGSVVSFVIHLALIALLLTPLAMLGRSDALPEGGGGPGRRGGGGGGNRGTGAVREVVNFVRPVPPAPKLVVPKVVQPPPPVPVVTPPITQFQVAPIQVAQIAMPTGAGGGTGSDNSGGSGSGTGGGVGTGTGTGRGSGVGAGAGGGYAPEPIEMFMPPLPVPGSVKGHRLVAEFDVDEKGKVLAVAFNETRDRGYNKRLTDVLRAYRFRPGRSADSVVVRMKATVVVDLY